MMEERVFNIGDSSKFEELYNFLYFSSSNTSRSLVYVSGGSIQGKTLPLCAILIPSSDKQSIVFCAEGEDDVPMAGDLFLSIITSLWRMKKSDMLLDYNEGCLTSTFSIVLRCV